MVDVTGYAAAIKCEDLVLSVSMNSRFRLRLLTTSTFHFDT